MPTKLDEISRVIGNIEAEIRGLAASVAEVRHTTTEQHHENREKLETIWDRVQKIEADLKPLAKTVATMEPIVAGYAVNSMEDRGRFRSGHDDHQGAWMACVSFRRQNRSPDRIAVSLRRCSEFPSGKRGYAAASRCCPDLDASAS